MEPEDTLALEGDGATLRCEAEGSPRPLIAWYRVGPEEDGPPGDSGEEDEERRISDGDSYEVKEDELYIK